MTDKEIIEELGNKNYKQMHNLNSAYVALQSYLISHKNIDLKLVALIQDYIDASIEHSNFTNEIINTLYKEWK